MRTFIRANLLSILVTVAAVLPTPALAQPAEGRPAPGEDVMQPTQRGLRLTPDIARGIGRLWMRETLWKDVNLSEEQEQRIADATARRMMRMAHRDGREGQSAFEYLIETGLATQGKVNADNCREFAEKVQPLVRGMREILDGVANDAREVLSEEQLAQLDTELGKQRRAVDRFERRLQGYRDGNVGENDNPFDELDAEEEVPGQKKVDQRVRNARRMADWHVRQITTWEWSRFLAGAVAMFKFDEAQQTKGEALLAAYRKKANAVQTPEWKARLRRNRTLHSLQWQLEDAPRGPWVYRLEQEYKEAVRPLSEMTAEFTKEVLALATAQQRADAIQEARRVFEKYGLETSEADAAILEGLLK